MNNDKNIKEIIDSRLLEITINEELENKILNISSKTKKVRKRSLTIAAAVCLCIILSVPIMAATLPAFNKLLNLVSSKTAQNLQPIEMICENNGIKMEVVAAMNDDETAIVYLTMQDLVGDRIDETVDLYNYSIKGANTFTHELINYDEATKTATIRMMANGGNKLNGKKVTFRVDSFLSGKEYFENVDTGIILEDIASKTPETILRNIENISGGGVLFDELRKKDTINILKPDNINISLPNIDFMKISNIGYVNGRLHVQIKWKDSIDNHGFLYLTNATSQNINPSSVSFAINEDSTTKYGNKFEEYIFEIDSSQVSNYSLKAYLVNNNNYTEGKWQTTFKIKSVDKTNKLEGKVNLDNVNIDTISITPIGINIIGKDENLSDLDIKITMNNGSIVAYNHTIINETDGKSTVKYLSNAPIKIENIQKVRINGNVVNLK
ncbi:hypothetical protein SH2C18_51420 [Clostridium sediminicola]